MEGPKEGLWVGGTAASESLLLQPFHGLTGLPCDCCEIFAESKFRHASLKLPEVLFFTPISLVGELL